MGKYRLTNEADLKIDEIYEYSILNFGLEKAQDYILGMHERFGLLADNPSWGNDYGHIIPGLFRYEHVSHAIYYQQIGVVCGTGRNPTLRIFLSSQAIENIKFHKFEAHQFSFAYEFPSMKDLRTKFAV